MRISSYIDAPAKSLIFVDASIFLYALTSGPTKIVPRSKKVKKEWAVSLPHAAPEIAKQITEEREQEPGYAPLCRELLKDGLNRRYHIFTTSGVIQRVVEVIAQIQSQPSLFAKNRAKAPAHLGKNDALNHARRWALGWTCRMGEYLNIACPVPEDFSRANEIAHKQTDMPFAWALDLAIAEREAQTTPKNPLRVASFSAKANTIVNGDKTKMRRLVFAPYIAWMMEREAWRRKRLADGIAVEPSLAEVESRRQAALWNPYFPGISIEK